MVRVRPNLVTKARADVSLFQSISRALTNYPHLDRGDQVKTQIEEVIAQIQPALPPDAAAKVDSPKPAATDGHKMELGKQIVITLGAIIVALIGVWGSGKIGNDPSPNPPPDSQRAAVEENEDAAFVTQYDYRAEEIQQVEYDLEQGAGASDSGFLRVQSVAFGRIGTDRAFSVRLSLTNNDSKPMVLSAKRDFFSLEDEQGREATLVSFCCDTRVLLSRGRSREIRLVFRAPAVWFGKDDAPDALFIRVEGFSPVTRAAWSFQPLRVAA
jgi:hypothetical protein